MEFLRFGSSIPGSYWGCCAVCIIQNFKVDPEDKASIEVVNGDGGNPINGYFLGKTYREIFEARMAIGTFSDQPMPNHAFFAVLTDWQIRSTIGSKWLKILKDHGFEFIRSVDNSVYSGPSLHGSSSSSDCDCDCDEDYDCDCYDDEHSSRYNYIFGLFRNIGNGKVDDAFTPPEAWTKLEGGVLETSSLLTTEQMIELQESRDSIHLDNWSRINPVTFYTKEQLAEQGVPVWLAGLRSNYPQQTEKLRNEAVKQHSAPQKPAPWAATGG